MAIISEVPFSFMVQDPCGPHRRGEGGGAPLQQDSGDTLGRSRSHADMGMRQGYTHIRCWCCAMPWHRILDNRRLQCMRQP